MLAQLRVPVLVALVLASPLGAALAQEFSPADRILVIDAGGKGKFSVQTTENTTFTINSSAKGISVTPTTVENKNKANFKVELDPALNGGPFKVTVGIGVLTADGGPPPSGYDVLVYVPMSSKDAEKGLKSATKAAEKSYGGDIKEALSGAGDDYDALLDELELALESAGDAEGGSRTIAMLRAAYVREALFTGLEVHMVLMALLMDDHYSWGISALVGAQFWLYQYGLVAVASYGFLSVSGSLWGGFLGKMLSLATGNAMKGQQMYDKYLRSVAKLAAGYGLVVPMLLWLDPYGLQPRCLPGPTDVAQTAALELDIQPPAELTPKSARKLVGQVHGMLAAEGGGDGVCCGTPAGIPLQVSVMLSTNNINLGNDLDDEGSDHGVLMVGGMAPPENGDLTVELTLLNGPEAGEGGPDVSTEVSEEELDINDGAFAVIFGEFEAAGDASALGTLLPGYYLIALVQDGLRLEKYLNVPSFNEQTDY